MGISQGMGVDALRGGVVTSSTRPTSPYEGQLIYETDTDRVLVYNNTAWVDPSTGRTEKSGLAFIKEVSLTTVTNNVSDVFSSNYDAYKIIVTDLNNASATTRLVSLRFRSSGGDDSTANYFTTEQFYYATNNAGQGTATGATSGVLTYFSSNTASGGSIILDVNAPNLAKMTTWTGSSNAYQSNVAAYVNRLLMGGLNTTTQYTGFSIIGTTDNLSGTVRVYGYNK